MTLAAMAAARFRFDDFELDAVERRLLRGDAPVELNARYLDALVLLVREQGRLVSKDRFLDTVWQGIPVTEEALTQCIRTLRKQLGDSVAKPRYIETVPKHGYRFIAPVESNAAAPEATEQEVRTALPYLSLARDIGAAALGGGFAGVVAGLLYLSVGMVAPAMERANKGTSHAATRQLISKSRKPRANPRFVMNAMVIAAIVKS